jgi:proline racemase
MEFSKTIRVVETHTEGMPARIVMAGFPHIPGKTMPEKAEFLRLSEEMQGLATMIGNEPRGHSGQFGALLTEPINPESKFGLVFFAPNFGLGGCGHATIGAATALVEMGIVSGELPLQFKLDTPVGTVEVRVNGNKGKVESVSFRNVPSFLYDSDVDLDVPGIGVVKADICFGGNFYAFLWAPDLGLRVRQENVAELRRIGTIIIQAVVDQLDVDDLPPSVPRPRRLGAIMLRDEPLNPEAHQKNIVMGGVGFDRSPCGTGTSGWMAALHARGKLKIGEEFVHESIVGSLFRGRALETVKIGRFDGIMPEITGRAYITAFHDLVLDPRDPYPKGFSFPGL